MSDNNQPTTELSVTRSERIRAAVERATERMKTSAHAKLDQFHAGEISREEYYVTDSSDEEIDEDIREEVRAARAAELPQMLDELASNKASVRAFREESRWLRRAIAGEYGPPPFNFDDPDFDQKFYEEIRDKLEAKWQKLQRNEITRAEFFDSSSDELDEILLGEPLKMQDAALYRRTANYRSKQLPTTPRYQAAAVQARMKLHRLAMGDFAVEEFFESSDDEELALLTKIGPTDEDTLKTAEARMQILDAKRTAKHETLKAVLSEVASKIKDGTLPAKAEPASDPSDDEYDNTYDLHEDRHPAYPTCRRSTCKAKWSQKQPPRPKKPEPTPTAHEKPQGPAKKKAYNLRDRKKLEKPKRLGEYVTLPELDTENRKKHFHQGAVVDVPQPGPSSAMQPPVLHLCSHGVVTGPGTVDLTFYVRGYKPGSDDPVTIRIT